MFLFYPKFPRLRQHEMGTMWFNFNVMPPAFKTVAVIGRYNTAEIAESLLGLATLLQQRGCAVLIEKETAANIGGDGFASGDYAAIGAQADLAVVLGGDGSMLSAARHLAAHGVPLVGVNQGRLGFMTDIAFSHMRETIELLLSGQYTVGERTMLEAQVLRGEKEIFRTQALNDIVVNKGATGRMIEFLVHIDGQFVYELAVDVHQELDHASGGALVDDDVVERLGAENLLLPAQHLGLEHGALSHGVLAGEQQLDGFPHVRECDVGHEAQPPLVDADQRHPVGSQVTRGREHAAVATQHHGEVGLGADGGVVAARSEERRVGKECRS